MKQPCRILTVCSANLCRSVTAAEYGRRAASETVSPSVVWEFDSAGIEVMPGQRLPGEVAEAMDDMGIPRRDRPMRVSEEAVRAADIVLTAERRHRAAVVQQFPFAVQYTFTILQFARLVEAGRMARPELETGRCADLLDLARVGRSRVQPVEDDSIDVPDPVIAGSRSAMTECAQVVETAVATIMGLPPARTSVPHDASRHVTRHSTPPPG